MKTVATPKKITSCFNAPILILSIVSGLLVVTVIVLAAFTCSMWRSQNSNTVTIRGLIKDAINGLYQPVVINPLDKHQYIYEASIKFPVSPTYNNFRYSYQPAVAKGGFKEQVTLTTAATLGAGYGQLNGKNLGELFLHVPNYQVCSKEFIIQFAPGVDDSSFTQVASKQLADGRTAYIYQNTGCNAFYKAYNVDDTANAQVVESIQSY